MNKSLLLFISTLVILTVLVFLVIYHNQYISMLKTSLALNYFCEQYGEQITNSFNSSINSTLINKIYNNESVKIFCFYSPSCSNYGSPLLKNIPSCMCNVLTKNKIIETNICIKITS